MVNPDTRLIVRRKLEVELLQLSQQTSHFTLETSIANQVGHINESDVLRVISKILLPIERASEKSYFYLLGHDSSLESIEKWPFLHKSRGKYEAKDVDSHTAEYVDFLQNIDVYKGTFLWVVKNGKLALGDVLPELYDPFVFGNLGSLYSKSAIRYAKKMIEVDSGYIFFSIGHNGGLRWVTIFACEALLKELLGLALETCRFSANYIKRTSFRGD